MALELSWLRWQEMKTRQTHTRKKNQGSAGSCTLIGVHRQPGNSAPLLRAADEGYICHDEGVSTFSTADKKGVLSTQRMRRRGLANLASRHLSMRAVLGFSHTGRENWDRYVLHSQSTPYLDQGKALAFLWVWPRKGLTIATGLVSLTRRWSCQNCTPPQDFSVLRTVHRWNDGVPETKWSRAVFSHLTAGSHACCHPT